MAQHRPPERIMLWNSDKDIYVTYVLNGKETITNDKCTKPLREDATTIAFKNDPSKYNI